MEKAMAENARALGTQLVMRGHERGADLLRQAAVNGDAKAQYNLAVAYMTGAIYGVPQPKAALHWYALAAAAGFAPAAYNAGVLHAANKIPGARPEHATYWMCRAASLRHTRALRWLYANRNGVGACHRSSDAPPG
jgi:TPR repeat protein